MESVAMGEVEDDEVGVTDVETVALAELLAKEAVGDTDALAVPLA